MAKAFDVDTGGTLTTSLKAWYNLEDETDSFSTNNLTNRATLAFGAGLIGNAATPDGADSLDVATVFSLGTTNVSISCWVNLETTSESGTFVKIGDALPAGAANDGYLIGVGASTAENSGNDLIILYEGVRWIDTNDLIGTGWHHIVLTLNGSGHPEAFIDGASVYSDSTGGPIQPTVGTGIGAGIREERHLTAGNKIDLVGIWGKQLSSQEITDLYNAGAGNAYREQGGAAFKPRIMMFS